MLHFSPAVNGLILSLLAGLATTIGAALALFVKKDDYRILALGLGFSAGVMLEVSFVELLGQAISHAGFLAANLAFFAGIILIFLVDNYVPHEYIAECIPENSDPKKKKLMRTGLMIAAGIAIHNIAEGITVFVGTVHSLGIGIILAIAIAIHNIPEGISVSLPVYCATNSRRQAFWLATYSGLTEPIGALLAFLFLWPFLTPFLINCLLAFTAGIMVYITFDELLPAAHKYGEEHVVACGLIIGMMLMATTLYFLR